MTFGSACSGIESASMAFLPLGWECRFVAEIDPYCCHLLHQRHGTGRPQFMPRPDDAKDEEDRRERIQNIKLVKSIPEGGLPNLGDMMQADPSEYRGLVDVFIAGTPCQSYSIAGLRKGLNDDRGNLTLRFVEYVDAIEPRYLLWENVPGVLSDSTNAFGCLLGGLVGADSPLVPGKEQRWTNFGMVDGPKRRVAWRILDAQWFGVAQRRERVFVVGSTRDGAHPLEILLEREGMQWNSPPSREKRQRPSAAAAIGIGTSGTDKPDTNRGLVPSVFQDSQYGVSEYDTAGALRSGRTPEHQMVCAEVSPTLNTSWADRSPGSQAQEWDSERGGRFVLTSAQQSQQAEEE